MKKIWRKKTGPKSVPLRPNPVPIEPRPAEIRDIREYFETDDHHPSELPKILQNQKEDVNEMLADFFPFQVNKMTHSFIPENSLDLAKIADKEAKNLFEQITARIYLRKKIIPNDFNLIPKYKLTFNFPLEKGEIIFRVGSRYEIRIPNDHYRQAVLYSSDWNKLSTISNYFNFKLETFPNVAENFKKTTETTGWEIENWKVEFRVDPILEDSNIEYLKLKNFFWEKIDISSRKEIIKYFDSTKEKGSDFDFDVCCPFFEDIDDSVVSREVYDGLNAIFEQVPKGLEKYNDLQSYHPFENNELVEDVYNSIIQK